MPLHSCRCHGRIRRLHTPSIRLIDSPPRLRLSSTSRNHQLVAHRLHRMPGLSLRRHLPYICMQHVRYLLDTRAIAPSTGTDRETPPRNTPFYALPKYLGRYLLSHAPTRQRPTPPAQNGRLQELPHATMGPLQLPASKFAELAPRLPRPDMRAKHVFGHLQSVYA
jgi:hypothetical protein